MKVTIKDFAVDMQVKTNGVEFEVRDNSEEHLGDLVVTKTNLIWCQGRTTRKNGVKVPWKQFITWMEERD